MKTHAEIRTWCLLGCDRRLLVTGFSISLLCMAPSVSSQSPTSRAAGAPPQTALVSRESVRAQGDSVGAVRGQLEQEKLRGEIEKLSLENRNNRRSVPNFLYSNASVLVAIILGFLSFIRYLQSRQEELRKREDERFEQVVAALGGERDQERVGAAVLLPTFLRSGYERFYVQVFNLAAGNLRALPAPRVRNSAAAVVAPQLSGESVTALRQALVTVFQDAYPLARKTLARPVQHRQTRQYLNAEGVRLDGAFLASVELQTAWLRGASFCGSDLTAANLTDAVLENADMSEARLDQAMLRGSNLISSNFAYARLNGADLSDARIDTADFSFASLSDITMIGGTAIGVDFSHAELSGATFRRVLFGSTPHQASSIEVAASLSGAAFHDVEGLSEAQVMGCIYLGATFWSGGVVREAKVAPDSRDERVALPGIAPDAIPYRAQAADPVPISVRHGQIKP
jgi:uncharacterized protein YjbI with pentapeptide repeats